MSTPEPTQSIDDEVEAFRQAAAATHAGPALRRVLVLIDGAERRWRELGREPLVKGGTVAEGHLAFALHGFRRMVADAAGRPPPPSPTAELQEQAAARRRRAEAAAARRAVREELRQADLAQRRAEKKSTRDAKPKPVKVALARPPKPRPTPEPSVVDPNQLSLF